MKTINFKELPSNTLNGGIQYKFKADNGFGASIVQHSFSYGNKKELWELAVLDKEGNLIYTTPITDNVLGYLSEEKVNQTLLKIEQL